MSAVSLTLDVPEPEAERVEDLLWDAGATGLEIRDREAPPMPGVRGPAPGEAIVVAWFDERASAEAALVDVVNRGGDTDTNAAITGALLGAYHGAEAIPEHWAKAVLDAVPAQR